MRTALLIAHKDLRQRMRDRSALVLGFVAPLVIAALMSFAFQGTDSFHTTLDLVDQDHGEVSAAFVQMLHDPQVSKVLTVRAVSSIARARSDVDAGTAGAAIVVPSTFTAAAHGGRPTPVTVLASVDHAIDAQLAEALTHSFTAQLDADRLSVATALAAGAPARSAPALASASAELRLPVSTVHALSGRRAVTAIGYYGPAMGIFFMFFSIGFGARGFFMERRGGTLDRIMAAPVPAWSLLAGKSLATFAYGVASLTTMYVVTTVAFHAYWGPPWAVAAIVTCLAITLVALTAAVTTLSRTERQADGLASIVTFGLVLLGGNFIVLASAPAAVRTLALLTPNGWALRAFTDLSTGASAGEATAGPVLAILCFALVVGVLAAVGSRRAVRR
ncbi:ABC transporter permease [Pedococcus sp. KACC 23699]|uniref:ABC transporter permease n=1 Tax=Pedococcus sp. KACC 23699 TaxID=3149228 RepID=A0AAU7JR16_9MICO